MTDEWRERFYDPAPVHRLASQFADLLAVGSVVRDDVEAVESTMEKNLAQLDEFHLLLRSVRDEQQQFRAEVVPQLIALSKKMEDTFRLIDEIDEAVRFVHRTVNKAGERIDATDKAYSSKPLDKMLSSIKLPFFSVRHACDPECKLTLCVFFRHFLTLFWLFLLLFYCFCYFFFTFLHFSPLF